jgi:hypothetical protein
VLCRSGIRVEVASVATNLCNLLRPSANAVINLERVFNTMPAPRENGREAHVIGTLEAL